MYYLVNYDNVEDAMASNGKIFIIDKIKEIVDSMGKYFESEIIKLFWLTTIFVPERLH